MKNIVLRTFFFSFQTLNDGIMQNDIAISDTLKRIHTIVEKLTTQKLQVQSNTYVLLSNTGLGFNIFRQPKI